jgi:hypothetical protein
MCWSCGRVDPKNTDSYCYRLSPNNRYVDIRVHKQIPLLAEENVSRASESIYFCMCLIMNSYVRQLVVWRGLLRST